MKRAEINVHVFASLAQHQQNKRKNETGEINIGFGWQQVDNLVFQTSILAQNFAASQKIVAL